MARSGRSSSCEIEARKIPDRIASDGAGSASVAEGAVVSGLNSGETAALALGLVERKALQRKEATSGEKEEFPPAVLYLSESSENSALEELRLPLFLRLSRLPAREDEIFPGGGPAAKNARPTSLEVADSFPLLSKEGKKIKLVERGSWRL